MNLNYSPTIAQRLQRGLVRRDNGCIEWVKATSHWGYGRIARGGRTQGWAATHRVAWELANRQVVPDGLYVLHHCDNPPCCNPDHLFLGTLRDNTQDMIAKGREAGQIPAGERHPSARLSDEDVARLRAMAASVGNYAALGRVFGISKQHARALAIGQKRAA